MASYLDLSQPSLYSECATPNEKKGLTNKVVKSPQHRSSSTPPSGSKFHQFPWKGHVCGGTSKTLTLRLSFAARSGQ